MDMLELRRKKKALEIELEKKIDRFCKETHTTIDALHLNKMDITCRGDKKTDYLYSIDIQILI